MHVSKQGLAFILVHDEFHSSPLVQWEEQLFSINCSSVLCSNVREIELVAGVQDITSQGERQRE